MRLLRGRSNRPQLRVLHVRPSVRPSVLYGLLTEKQKGLEKKQNPYECSAEHEQLLCQFSAQKFKRQADNRTICRHWADVVS